MQISTSKLTYSQIRTISEKFLKDYHPSLSIPIPIEEIVELKLKVKISTTPNLKSEFDIDGFINSEFSEITLDDEMFNKFEERARFTISHEIGHGVLHSKIYKNCKIQSKEDYLKFQQSLTDENQKWLEIQAHIFAACVLVPTEKLKEEIKKAVGKQHPQAEFSIPYLQSLPEKFKVSTDVIYRRIQKEKLLAEY
ncbi:MAG: hypothetical protein UT84_C0003G0004 [Candidatus Curtissbacteria bacterium GW2011_GWA1_40_16]|uniref:IrrE N-terminal-like domain-containing protein n=1 Tax=Candidatus Curtissbacteria bacterium GW2011_GWA1_40_16 TaxID=1618405 RepID=A0A0G0RE66_9BACT|nr:MAG: hypothetical protein UT84_C0003G0004 [Candidatus Curtissbacteria bacterium GW2011_GWA1_40_16]